MILCTNLQHICKYGREHNNILIKVINNIFYQLPVSCFLNSAIDIPLTIIKLRYSDARDLYPHISDNITIEISLFFLSSSQAYLILFSFRYELKVVFMVMLKVCDRSCLATLVCFESESRLNSLSKYLFLLFSKKRSIFSLFSDSISLDNKDF